MKRLITYYLNPLILLLLVTGFWACEKVEKPVKLPPKPAEDLRVIQLDLGENYESQIFLNIFDSIPVKTSVKCSDWDLAFESKSFGFRITMNGGAGVLIANSGKTRFERVNDPEYLHYRWDEASGGDSISLINWCDKNMISKDSVYVVDRGILKQDPYRFYQFKILGVTPYAYFLEICDIKGKNIKQIEIPKNPLKQNTYLSFGDGNPRFMDFEPYKKDWQFCFLRYRWVYYEFNPPLLYTVTGIYINNENIQVAVDSTFKFESIGMKDLENMNFHNRRDIIGYDWKNYDFNNGRYKTRNHVNYIIKTNEPQPKFFKLRFTDFYSVDGLKGSPKFEISEIHP